MGPGLTLLLVEDDPDDARVVERLLSQYQPSPDGPDPRTEIDVETVNRVDRLDDALAHVDESAVDLVILDLGLPDSSGTETVDAMADHAPGVPIVVLTGRTDAGVEAIRAGAQDYLVKGTITAELLVRTLRYAIERAQTTRELRDRNHRLAVANEIVRQDLRDDLSVIVGMGDQLADDVDPEHRPVVESLLDAGRDALDLATTASDLMDVLSGERPLDDDPTDLRNVLESVLDDLQTDPDTDLTVEWFVADDDPMTVAGTPMLGAAFEQLLSNATDQADRETAAVDVAIEATDDHITVTTENDGAEMTAPQKRALTDPATNAPDDTGIGAGLYFVGTVLDSVDAAVDVDDGPQGTVVTVTLDRIGRYPNARGRPRN